MHKYTLHSDDPEFVRARMNAQQISDVRILSHNPKYKHIQIHIDICQYPFCKMFNIIFLISL